MSKIILYLLILMSLILFFSCTQESADDVNDIQREELPIDDIGEDNFEYDPAPKELDINESKH